MNIREWPAQERPREKLLLRGAAALSDAELLAVLLGSGVAGRNVLDLARGLLVRFGGLRQFLEAEREAVLREPGIGTVKYAQLQALLEIGRRYLDENLERAPALEGPAAVRRYLKAMLRHEISEVFGCLFLDTKHRPLAFEILFRGTIDRASVYPREVVRRALLHNAAAMILCHNHPSGNNEPSQDDVHLTLSLKRGLALIDVRVLDHIIIGDGEPLSMVENGWIVA
ncbi:MULTISPECIES: RadC family protein [Pseudomonas]|uniref:MPN domain-containing protein n=1 Tax=Pseudomonas putida NBRC 14164 TaxID=1211579 RepID=A0ABN5UVS2_PSEPU|nr:MULTISPECIES: DNA repair protein RadC [Pseudomonas]EKT4459439.1 DNA repair protein RadC [Pseudomonas putida]EKT4553698.1 DNA repair protein RadC [Pseudomonas putida]MCX9137671.1 DNA repair protein RadC [Pseudomonas sp. DCB_PUT]MDD1973075.1 DNA repair protein RadC [Pseudomonas putida]MDO1465082.1 DNA repair protein RadC [Pseudomonas putida]